MGAGIGILPGRCFRGCRFFLLVIRIEAADAEPVNCYVRDAMIRLQRNKCVQLRHMEKAVSI
jgi:hypothetical protein